MRIKELFNRLSALLLGHDIFISYHREDATRYAEALAERLKELGFLCFLDREETVPGVHLGTALRIALRRSRTLVAILTPGVLESSWIQQEVEAFRKRRNRFIPVNVGHFLSGADVDHTVFSAARELSWLDETPAAVESGVPSAEIVESIRRTHNRLRVRTIGKLLLAGIGVALAGGGAVATQIVLEERRQAEVAYDQIRTNAGRLRGVLRYLVFASQGMSWSPISLRLTAPPGGYGAPEIISSLQRLDFAAPARYPGPVTGFSLSPPGDRRRVSVVVSTEMTGALAELDRLWKQNLPLADRDTIELTRQVARHPFAQALSRVDASMNRYHEIEDSQRMPYYLLRSPGVSTTAAYLDFVQKLEQLTAALPAAEAAASGQPKQAP